MNIEEVKQPPFMGLQRVEFEKKFVNKPLEHLAGKAYDIMVDEYKQKDGYYQLRHHFETLTDELRRILAISDLIKDLGDAKTSSEHYISNYEDAAMVIKWLEKAYLEKLSAVTEAINKVYESARINPDFEQVIHEHSMSFFCVPEKKDIIILENGRIHPTDFELSVLNMSSLLKDIDGLNNQNTSLFCNKLMFLPVQAEMKRSNKLFLDMYEFLWYAGVISEEQKKVHENSSSLYVKENFIKQRYNRLMEPWTKSGNKIF